MNPANSPSASSSSDSQELLERGRLTLQAIQYHERAARYKAAAASLQAAMLQAENGNAAKLHEWLESESHQFDTELDFITAPNLVIGDVQTHSLTISAPITRPAESRSGPPEFPGFMAASVWMTPDISRPPAVGMRRFNALMTPVVSV